VIHGTDLTILENQENKDYVFGLSVKSWSNKKESLMIRVENSVLIEQPVGKVFEYVTDISNNPKWQTDILELAITSTGPFELGSTYRCVNRFMGKRIETEGVITEFVPDQACSFRITSGSVTGESRFLFEGKNGTTKFTTSAALELGFLNLGKVIVKRKICTQLKNDMCRLKAILENGHKL
jgi:uncharacterized membrane protein